MIFIGWLFSIVAVLSGLFLVIIYIISNIQSMVESSWTETVWILGVGLALLIAGLVLLILLIKKTTKKAKEPKEPTPEEIEKAKENALIQKAEEGNKDDQYELGLYFERKIKHEDALNWFKKAAEQGHDNAEVKIGYYYQTGIVLEKDYQKAYEWYKKAEEKNNLSAIYNIGVLNEEGRIDGKEHPKKAFSYFSRAADLGHTLSMVKVGKAYIYRLLGVASNKEKGLEYLKKAAELNNAEAYYELSLEANRVWQRNYGMKSYDDWYENLVKAAELGFGQAQYEYACHLTSSCWKNDGGYTSNYKLETGEKYMSLAIKNGCNDISDAKKKLNAIRAMQKKREQERLEKWRKQEEKERQMRLEAQREGAKLVSGGKNSSYTSNQSSSSKNNSLDEAKRKTEFEKQKALEKDRNRYFHYDTKVDVTYFNEHSGFMGMTVYDADANVTFIYKNYYGSTKTKTVSLRFNNVEYKSITANDCEYRCQSYLGEY